MSIDIEHLKAAALVATPGPWPITEYKQEEAYDASYIIQIGEDDSIDDRSYYPHAPSRIEDARFIAAANPAVVLELVAEVERLRAAASAVAAREAARQSIDTPEFRELFRIWDSVIPGVNDEEEIMQRIIAHIDTWGGAALAANTATQKE